MEEKMGVMVSKDMEENTRLNSRISSDLRQRAQMMREVEDDEEYADDRKSTKRTNKFGWVWIVLIVLAIISLICIAFI